MPEKLNLRAGAELPSLGVNAAFFDQAPQGAVHPGRPATRPHKVLIELADPTHKVITSEMVKLTVPGLKAQLCGAAVMLGFSTLRGSNAESSHHVYELRLYHVNEGKMDALKARFRDHVDAIFRRHNMESIGCWSPEDAPDSQSLLIYILQHSSRQEAEKNWAAFQADPEWPKVKAESEANGKLVDHIDHYFMDPTNFSALK